MRELRRPAVRIDAQEIEQLATYWAMQSQRPPTRQELAAIIVEPVQSRRPSFAPVEFLKEVREVLNDPESRAYYTRLLTDNNYELVDPALKAT